MKKALLVVALACSIGVFSAVTELGPSQAAPGPVKVVVLVVDGLDPADVSPVTSPVLSELKAAGIWYEQARAVMVAETIPNHVAMMTGAYPARNGIPVNSFWDRSDGEVGAEMDDPRLLKAQSMFTAIQKQCSELRTAAVLSKSYLHGIFSGDHDGDGRIDADSYWDPSPYLIPGSNHAPDNATTEAVVAEIANQPDLLFANLGDVDRSGHVDPTGPAGTAATRLSVLNNTDRNVGRIVDALKTVGTWEETVLLVVSDHSMDWSSPEGYVSLDEEFATAERIAGTYEIVQNGGVDNVYLKPEARKGRGRVLRTMRRIALGQEGVAQAFYRRPLKIDPKGAVVPRAWGMRTRRVGDLIALADPGYRFSDPSSTSNPIPGNHGHAITRHAVALVTGGSPLVRSASIAPSAPGSVDPLNDTRRLPEQSEQVDIGVTVAWLLGVADPGGEADPQFQGRPLTEALSARPPTACGQGAAI